MSAVDVAGRELKVGQLVAHTERAAYRGLTTSRIVKITAKQVELSVKSWSGADCGMRREHSAVCIVEDI